MLWLFGLSAPDMNSFHFSTHLGISCSTRSDWSCNVFTFQKVVGGNQKVSFVCYTEHVIEHLQELSGKVVLEFV